MSGNRRQLVARAVRFLSACDEEAFFGWLDKLQCVLDYEGVGLELLINLRSDSLDDESLRELIALFTRYGVSMRQLAVFETDENRAWFRNRRAYWHADVFGQSADRKARREEGSV